MPKDYRGERRGGTANHLLIEPGGATFDSDDFGLEVVSTGIRCCFVKVESIVSESVMLFVGTATGASQLLLAPHSCSSPRRCYGRVGTFSEGSLVEWSSHRTIQDLQSLISIILCSYLFLLR